MTQIIKAKTWISIICASILVCTLLILSHNLPTHSVPKQDFIWETSSAHITYILPERYPTLTGYQKLIVEVVEDKYEIRKVFEATAPTIINKYGNKQVGDEVSVRICSHIDNETGEWIRDIAYILQD